MLAVLVRKHKIVNILLHLVQLNAVLVLHALHVVVNLLVHVLELVQKCLE